jgi:hypothetical protein
MCGTAFKFCFQIQLAPLHEGHDGDDHHWRRRQGLTLVHFSAQLKPILWDRGAFRACSGGVWEVPGGIEEYEGVFRVYSASETAQVEQRC